MAVADRDASTNTRRTYTEMKPSSNLLRHLLPATTRAFSCSAATRGTPGLEAVSNPLTGSDSGPPPVTLRIDRAKRVATVTLDSPATRNALSLRTLRHLGACIAAVNPEWTYRDNWVDLDDLPGSLDRSGANTSIRCVLLRANYGDQEPAKRVWSSGHDLRELAAATREHRADIFRTCADITLALRRLPQPVIAVADGLVTAGGLGIFASSDVTLASNNARFQFPGVNLGGFCTLPSVPPSRLVSPARIFRMLATAQPVSAEQALDIGLISEVVPDGEDPHLYAEQMAESVGSRSGQTTFVGKWAFHRQRELPLEEALALAARVMVEIRELDDSKEGQRAWLEKRKPVWK
ncbi:ClpP/crotonase-like domain-containing protein [Hyaloraphidium curvatum]|nr:ClpP/crotonase-like domain-containing protein [Hyaloraphidium curvatum]